MLAVVSIFTGVIAPVGSYLGIWTPLPLTDKQWISYAMLGLLVIIFYLVSIRSWKKMRLFSFILIAFILSIFYLSVTDSIENIRTGYTLTSLSWWWIFLIAWSLLLLGTIVFEYEEYSPVSSLSDKIVGLIGSITLTFLTTVIFIISFVWPHGHNGKSILLETFGSWKIETHSWVILSPAFTSLSGIVFDRKNDSLSFDGINRTGSIQTSNSFFLGNKKIRIDEDKKIRIDEIIQSGSLIHSFWDNQGIVLKDNNSLRFITTLSEKSFMRSVDLFTHITKDSSDKTFAWSEKTASWYVVIKNGEKVWKPLSQVDMISLSPSGYDIMVKWVTLSGATVIIKNGETIETMRINYILGTYKSNGSHFVYVIGKEGWYKIVYDWSIIQGEFEEVREIFLEKNGNSYGYFARPLGEKRYCLFTRYRGNICWLDGYMNPKVSADGWSILFAGLKNDLWSIYRNTGIVIRDSGYTKKNIINDYMFLDITNPRQYLFIEKNDDGMYWLRKNGKMIPGNWQDVWLDVTFWYDNKIIMTAKDALWWRILEF
jgi:hypothetical protein